MEQRWRRAGALLALVIAPELAGAQTPAEVRALNEDGRFTRAAELASAGLAGGIERRSPEAVELLCLRAVALRRGPERRAPETLALAQEAVLLGEELLDESDPRLGEAWLELGALRAVRGENDEAHEAFERARALALGDWRAGSALAYLAYLAWSVEGDSGRAFALLDEAERNLSGRPAQHAFALEMRALVLGGLRRDAEERAALERAIELRRSAQRADHPMLVHLLSRLAQVELDAGELASAIPRLEELARLGDSGAEIAVLPATVHEDLGAALTRVGRFDEAEEHFLAARRSLAELGLAGSLRDGTALRGLATLAVERGDLALGRELAEQALEALRPHALEDPYTFESTLLLAGWMDLQSDAIDEAARRLDEARALASGPAERALEPDRLALEAWIAGARGAEPAHMRALYERALGIEKELASEVHPFVPVCLRTLARLAWLEGERAEALELSLDAERAAREQWLAVAPRLSELSAIGLGASDELQANLDVALLAAAADEDPAAAERVWNARLERSERVFAERAQRALLASTEPALRVPLERLARAREALAALYVRAAQGHGGSVSATALEATGAERRAAERALADALPAEARTGTALDVAALRAALPERTALVAFVFAMAPGDPPQDELLPLAWSYAAWALVLPSPEAPVRVLRLGDASEIRALAAALEREGRRGLDVERWRAQAAALRALVWDPLAVALEGASTVLLVPAGPLARIPFDALPLEDGAWLAEKGPLLWRLDGERALCEPKRPAGDGLVALGDPAAPGWSALPEARREALEVAAAWRESVEEPALALSGADATEVRLRALAPHARVVHLAAHGYYEPLLADGLPALASDATLLAQRGEAPALGGATLALPLAAERSAEPLLRCGLVLAPASDEGASEAARDGILTAEEVLALPLGGVEWVVLSACDTALGEERAGEGQMGLVRAFRQAGARTVISSFWPVEDRDARAWMQALYHARFAEGRSTPEAVRAAQLAALAELSAAGEPAHPRRWASFVASGGID